MAKITIGNEDYVVPEMNFMGLERAWPFIETAMAGTADPMQGPLAAMRVIAAGLMEAEDFQPQRYGVTATPDDPDLVHDQVTYFLRKKLKANQIVRLKDCVDQIIVEAGLAAEPGESAAESLETPSPEIALAS